jgi:hypothetical protein
MLAKAKLHLRHDNNPVERVLAAYAEMRLAGVKPGFVPSAAQPDERVIAYG